MQNPSSRQTALITGASSGIGAALARLFAKDGYNLVLVARSEKPLQAMADELGRLHGIQVTPLPLDLARAESPAALAAALEARSIQVDVLVNNAGFGDYGLFAELALQSTLDMMQVNMVTLTHLTRLLLPGMIQRRRGKVLNVASTAAFQPGPLMAVYYATKAYVLSLSEALHNEVQGTGVSVTALCPGPTESPFQARANMQASKLAQSGLMDVDTVALAGYQALQANQPLVIPGMRNRLLAFATRLLPRAVITQMVRNTQERTHATA